MRTSRFAAAALALACASVGMHVAAREPARWRDTGATIRVDGDISLPRFSPDGARLAYAVERDPAQKIVAEIRSRTLANGRERVLLSLTMQQRGDAVGTYPTKLRWADATHLSAELSNGDDGSDVHRLDAEHAGSLGSEIIEAGEDVGRLPRNAPALRAVVPDWPQPVFENALQYRVGIRDRGALVQKHYAQQDDHLWWLDLRSGKATVTLAETPGSRQELMDGFAFGAHALFALRRDGTVSAQVLDETGRIAMVEGSAFGVDAGPNAINTWSGRIDQRRCSADACWALYTVRHDEALNARIVRLDRDGHAEVLAELPGLEDFDVSPDFGTLAATLRKDGRSTLHLLKIERF